MTGWLRWQADGGREGCGDIGEVMHGEDEGRRRAREEGASGWKRRIGRKMKVEIMKKIQIGKEIEIKPKRFKIFEKLGFLGLFQWQFSSQINSKDQTN